MAGKSRRFSNDASYAAVRISDDEKSDFLEYFATSQDDAEEIILEALREGYRFSLKYDFNSRCVQCSTTQQEDRHKNSGVILISRGNDPVETLFMNLYKLYRLYPVDPLPTTDEEIAWG